MTPTDGLRCPPGFASYLSAVGPRPVRGTLSNLLVLATVGSTNALGRRILDTYLADELTPPAVGILAYGQHAGRGRLGRQWTSSPGSGVWATLVAQVEAEQLAQLPLLVGVALVEALAGVLGEGAAGIRLKWPNDLVFERHKLGGILIEAVQRSGLRPGVVIGFGLNVASAPSEVPQALALHGLAEGARRNLPDTGGLGRLLLEAVAEVVGATPQSRWAADEVVARYRRWSAHRVGDSLRCRTGEATVEGRFRGFDEEGRLRLETAAGERLLASGEVIE
jgi:BirA family biotin operon repressor/biotin-[acetyl-CoA-carboxylase] ligase